MQKLRFVLKVIGYAVKVELMMMAMAVVPIMAGLTFIWVWKFISGW